MSDFEVTEGSDKLGALFVHLNICCTNSAGAS